MRAQVKSLPVGNSQTNSLCTRSADVDFRRAMLLVRPISMLGAEIIIRPVFVGGINGPLSGRGRKTQKQHGAAVGCLRRQFGLERVEGSSHNHSLHAPHGVSCEHPMIPQRGPD